MSFKNVSFLLRKKDPNLKTIIEKLNLNSLVPGVH